MTKFSHPAVFIIPIIICLNFKTQLNNLFCYKIVTIYFDEILKHFNV